MTPCGERARQSLARRPREEERQRTHDEDDALATRVNLDPSDPDAVLARDLVNLGHLALHLDEPLVAVPLVKQLADVARAHLPGERDRHGRDDALEPGRDVRRERELEVAREGRVRGDELGELVPCLALVDVVRERVGLDAALERLGGHLGLLARLGPRAREARDGKDGRRRRDVGEQGREEELRVGGEAARVRDALGRLERLAVVQLCVLEGVSTLSTVKTGGMLGEREAQSGACRQVPERETSCFTASARGSLHLGTTV